MSHHCPCELEHFPIDTEHGQKFVKEKREYLTIVGVGSLLDHTSAKRTFPNLKNFRLATIRQYVRSFNLVAISCIRMGFASDDSNKVASISACQAQHLPETLKQRYATLEGDDNENFLYVSVFETPVDCWPDFLKREHRYEYGWVRYETIDSSLSLSGVEQAEENSEQLDQRLKCGYGLICCQSTDETYLKTKCYQSSEVYHELVGQYFSGQLWYHSSNIACCSTEQDEQQEEGSSNQKACPILPVDKYVTHVLKACLQLGQQHSLGRNIYDNWLDHTYLCDFKTSLREYLQKYSPDLFLQ